MHATTFEFLDLKRVSVILCTVKFSNILDSRLNSRKKLYLHTFLNFFIKLIGSTLSEFTEDIIIGVIQGSILGVILFLIFMNDIYNCSRLIHSILFADDISSLYAAANVNLLQSEPAISDDHKTLYFIKHLYILFIVSKVVF